MHEDELIEDIASGIFVRLMSNPILQGPALEGGQPRLSFLPAEQCAKHALQAARTFQAVVGESHSGRPLQNKIA